jgi:hypothetical protein
MGKERKKTNADPEQCSSLKRSRKTFSVPEFDFISFYSMNGAINVGCAKYSVFTSPYPSAWYTDAIEL